MTCYLSFHAVPPYILNFSSLWKSITKTRINFPSLLHLPMNPYYASLYWALITLVALANWKPDISICTAIVQHIHNSTQKRNYNPFNSSVFGGTCLGNHNYIEESIFIDFSETVRMSATCLIGFTFNNNSFIVEIFSSTLNIY